MRGHEIKVLLALTAVLGVIAIVASMLSQNGGITGNAVRSVEMIPSPGGQYVFVDAVFCTSDADGSKARPFCSVDAAMKSARSGDVLVTADGAHYKVVQN